MALLPTCLALWNVAQLGNSASLFGLKSSTKHHQKRKQTTHKAVKKATFLNQRKGFVVCIELQQRLWVEPRVLLQESGVIFGTPSRLQSLSGSGCFFLLLCTKRCQALRRWQSFDRRQAPIKDSCGDVAKLCFCLPHQQTLQQILPVPSINVVVRGQLLFDPFFEVN